MASILSRPQCVKSSIWVRFLSMAETLAERVLSHWFRCTVYRKQYAHGFVVLCFVVVMQSFIMNSHEAFIHIHQGCFAGTGAIVRLPQCQWSKPDGYGKICQCITTTKHSKAKTVCIFLGIYCIFSLAKTLLNCTEKTCPAELLCYMQCHVTYAPVSARPKKNTQRNLKTDMPVFCQLTD